MDLFPLALIAIIFLLYAVFHLWITAIDLTRDKQELKQQLASAYDRLDWFNREARTHHGDDLEWPALDEADGQVRQSV